MRLLLKENVFFLLGSKRLYREVWIGRFFLGFVEWYFFEEELFNGGYFWRGCGVLDNGLDFWYIKGCLLGNRKYIWKIRFLYFFYLMGF